MKGEGCHLVNSSCTFGFGEIVAPNATAQSFCRARTECRSLYITAEAKYERDVLLGFYVDG